jgi:hypothetical protein
MDVAFLFLAPIVFLLMLAGLVKPEWVIRWEIVSGLENVQGSFRSLSVGRRQARTCVRLRKEPIELNRLLYGDCIREKM